MVVDNVDNANVMFEPWNGGAAMKPAVLTSSALSGTSSSTDHSLSGYLPSSANGSTVITSRSRAVAEGLIEYEDDILEVGPMDAETAVTLLMKRQEGGITPDDSAQLVQHLDYMPLCTSMTTDFSVLCWVGSKAFSNSSGRDRKAANWT